MASSSHAVSVDPLTTPKKRKAMSLSTPGSAIKGEEEDEPPAPAEDSVTEDEEEAFEPKPKKHKHKHKKEHATSDGAAAAAGAGEGKPSKSNKSKRPKLCERVRCLSDSAPEKLCFGPLHSSVTGAWIALSHFEAKKDGIGGVGKVCKPCKKVGKEAKEKEEETTAAAKTQGAVDDNAPLSAIPAAGAAAAARNVSDKPTAAAVASSSSAAAASKRVMKAARMKTTAIAPLSSETEDEDADERPLTELVFSRAAPASRSSGPGLITMPSNTSAAAAASAKKLHDVDLIEID